MSPVKVEHSGWKFTKEISIGNLLTIGSLVVILIAWGNKVENRLAVLETQTVVAKETDFRHEAEAERTRQEVARQLDRLNEKIDKLLQNRGISP